jgi:hypothetical protein
VINALHKSYFHQSAENTFSKSSVKTLANPPFLQAGGGLNSEEMPPKPPRKASPLPFALGVWTAIALGMATAGLSGCMSAYKQTVGGDTAQVFHRIYLTDFNTSWQAVLDAIKNARLDVSNREGGFVQTKWTDNTAEKNFVDSFGEADSYLKAQYRIRINVAKGFYNGQPSVKVSVQKEQLIQRDVLEGWRPIETDGVDERTLLYRVGRIIAIRMKMAHIEELKTQKALEDTGF